jgi:hypothetical protein
VQEYGWRCGRSRIGTIRPKEVLGSVQNKRQRPQHDTGSNQERPAPGNKIRRIAPPPGHRQRVRRMCSRAPQRAAGRPGAPPMAASDRPHSRSSRTGDRNRPPVTASQANTAKYRTRGHRSRQQQRCCCCAAAAASHISRSRSSIVAVALCVPIIVPQSPSKLTQDADERSHHDKVQFLVALLYRLQIGEI